MPVRVPRLEMPPHRCAFTLRGEDPEGFFLGETLSGWDPKAAVSVSFARTLARELGYAHPDAHEALEAELAAANAEVEHLRAQVARLEAEADAIDGLVRSREYVVRKRVGRPPAEREVAA